ncbi:MAG: MarR family winged helix-turn-helix transcriptional regulator [Chloroflexi bacterium]|nr:MarR family winged helix-turn-helix transcriptional regulator [Chloroflexota bacterium]MCY3687071.1 MarR family winged helix-turn-helix transcriptional regulator [Chloroflexota bacterium]MDE2708624.1 MarR family winged helix-turn-helix transcriptional regulator [Chloroflexota bacterium]
MRRDSAADSVLGWLSRAPLLDRLELAALSGWSRSAVYRAVEKLERERLVEPVAHASELIAPTRRYTLTAAGLRRLAESEGINAECLLRERPVSEQARRLFLGRIDALAAHYRLCCTVADLSFPIQARCYRALPVDLCLRLADDRTIALVRLGRINERRSLARRLARLRDCPAFAAVLLLAPDETRLRETARRLQSFPQPCFLALDRDAVEAGPDSLIWRAPSVEVALSLREALGLAGPQRTWLTERTLVRVSAPAKECSAGRPPNWMLPARLGPSEKRALDLIADWPWIRADHLAALLGVSRTRLRQLLRRAGEFGLIVRPIIAGRLRLALSDRGLALLARRDRASVGELRKRWSSESIAQASDSSWRNVKGTRSRQLLRNLTHTESVHGFLAALAKQARSDGWNLLQFDPPQHASRYFRFDDRLHSIQPDAFGVLHRGGRTQPFFLEWERRAIRPSTMAARLAPYLRYYSSKRPIEDHGAPPLVMVAFDDQIAADHFRSVAQEHTDRADIDLPLLVSDQCLLGQYSPFGPVWKTVEDSCTAVAFAVGR